MEKPLVSISCITFNHAAYIGQCLDGIMMQKTDFPFEVLIHDDASTDGTTEIIKEYEARYPGIVKPLYETENQWVKGRRGSAVFNYPRAQGKYIALCEGDDYWTDPLKLQKQVDFLEVSPEYSICFHSGDNLYPDNTTDSFSRLEDRDYSGYEILKDWCVPTASVLFRADVIHSGFYQGQIVPAKLMVCDTPLFLSCVKFGKARAFSDVMSVYRRLETGFSQGYTTDKYKAQVNYNLKMKELFPEYSDVFNEAVAKISTDGFVFSAQNGKPELGFLLKEIRLVPVSFIKEMMRRVKKNLQ